MLISKSDFERVRERVVALLRNDNIVAALVAGADVKISGAIYNQYTRNYSHKGIVGGSDYQSVNIKKDEHGRGVIEIKMDATILGFYVGIREINKDGYVIANSFNPVESVLCPFDNHNDCFVDVPMIPGQLRISGRYMSDESDYDHLRGVLLGMMERSEDGGDDGA